MRLRLRPLLVLAAGTVLVVGLAVVYLVLAAMPRPGAGGLDPEGAAEAAAALGRGFLAGGAAALTLILLAAWGAAGGLSTWLDRVRAATRAGAAADAPAPIGIRELDLFAAAAHAAAAERDRRLEALLRERDELAVVIEAVSEGIVQVGPDGRLVRANYAARALLRLGPGLEGQPVGAVVRSPGLRRLLERAAAGEPSGAGELILDERQLLVTAKPLAEHGGALAVLVDLTDLRRLEDVRRDFVANASHELKTPLTSIRGYAETLLCDELPPDVQRNFLETIHGNARRLQRIVEDLLDLSRIESGGWSPRLQRIEVAEAVQEAWEPFRERAVREGVVLVDRAGAAAVWADPGALRQIFTNLFDNALRYTPRGGRITVHANAETHTPGAIETNGAGHGAAEADGGATADTAPVVTTSNGGAGWVRLDVHDTGSGIPGAALPRIFERFYRADAARSREAGGTGLGLAIVKHLAERMGGDVSAESQLGHGATIRLRLPAPPL